MEHAIIKLNGKQYIVNKGSLMKLDRVNSETLVETLVYSNDKDVFLGEPILADFGVEFQIIEDKKDAKISVRRFKSKSKYRKEHGHRQPISIVKVIDFGKGIKTSFKEPREQKVVEEKNTEVLLEDKSPKEKTVKKVLKKAESVKKSVKSKSVKTKE